MHQHRLDPARPSALLVILARRRPDGAGPGTRSSGGVEHGGANEEPAWGLAARKQEERASTSSQVVVLASLRV